jgi:hypothetical protein
MPLPVPDFLALLRAHPLVRSLRVVEHDETPFGKLVLKVRCRLPGRYRFQVWLHYEPGLRIYAYQLFHGQPLLRWDNSPHYPSVVTAPHHFHDSSGIVIDSPLSGDPLADLPVVLSKVESFLKRSPHG